MQGRGRFIVVGALLLAILAMRSGFHRVNVTRFAPGPYVVDLPFGPGPKAVGRAVGIDGRPYGPLAFSSNGRTTVIADTYHERLLYFHHGRLRSRPVGGEMIEELLIDRAGRVFAVDNRSLSLKLYTGSSVRRVMGLKHQPGYSESLWHVGLAPNGRIIVESVRIGRGTLSTRIDEYSASGRFVRSLSETRVSQQGLQPESGSTIVTPVKSFQVAPDGDLYIEPQQTQGSNRIIRIYRENGLFMGNVVIRSPERIRRADFLGIDQQGWIYLAVNIDVPHKARILIVDGRGQMVANLHVGAIPVYGATYGYVLPTGVLYLDQSTRSSYRIREYRPVTRRVWRWTGF